MFTITLLSHFRCVGLCDPIDSSPSGSHPWDSPGKNTGVGCYFLLQCMKVNEVTQSCLTLSDPMDCSLPGSSIHGIFQARVLEWVAIAFSVTITRNRYYFSEIHPYITFLGYLCRIWFKAVKYQAVIRNTDSYASLPPQSFLSTIYI